MPRPRRVLWAVPCAIPAIRYEKCLPWPVQLLAIHSVKSIKSKVLVFAVVATLIPSITLGWVSYFRNEAIIREKAAQQLNAVAGFTSREIDLWVKERVRRRRFPDIR